MIGLLQRVTQASVDVAGQRIGAIGPGLLVLIGVRREDDAASGERLIRRLLLYRIFGDAAGRMNLNLAQAGGALLLVPQFTLAADTAGGLRPGFSTAAPPEIARERFEQVVVLARKLHNPVETGVFGADMQVALVNDGPVTFWLES